MALLSQRRCCHTRPCTPALGSLRGAKAAAAAPRQQHQQRRASAAARAGEPAAAAAAESRAASVAVDLGERIEQITIQLDRPDTTLAEARVTFPCGFVLENVGGEVILTELTEGGAAEAAGCRVGDVVRATTAMTMTMTYPTMNLMFGGVGRPKLAKVLVPTAKLPFSKVMDAVRSNSAAAGGDGMVALVLERPCSAAGGGEQQLSTVQERELVTAGVVAASGDSDGSGTVFDPQLFE